MNTKSLLLSCILWISSLSLSAQALTFVNQPIDKDTLLATVQTGSISSKTVMAPSFSKVPLKGGGAKSYFSATLLRIIKNLVTHNYSKDYKIFIHKTA